MTEYEEVYIKSQLSNIDSEFNRMKDHCYLEHVGATLYSDVQITNICKDLKNNLYGNPHAYNISSKTTGDSIDQIRYQVLEYLNADPDEYSIIFTSGATAALKIVAENFTYDDETSDSGAFVYLEDNHTSVLGMREYATNIKILKFETAFDILDNFNNDNKTVHNNNSLFVYPAESNFSGTKYPLSWIKNIQNGALNSIIKNPSNWFCLLDAASFIPTNLLDLNIYKPDFICMSFYKIFGYPTGVGALIVKNSSSHTLRKRYFGGGTVQMTLPKEHIFRTTLHERFEDGTLPFLSILSIRHGLETLRRLGLNMDTISLHTFSLAKYVYNFFLNVHHSNGNPLAILYHDTGFEDISRQGGIVNFNLLRSNGDSIGYSEVLQMANLHNIHLRTGCFCNPGACQRHLKLLPEDVKQHFNAGHVCGDQNDLIDDCPTGSVRISFGYMSTQNDADKFIDMIKECFVCKPIIFKTPHNLADITKIYNQRFLTTNDILNKCSKSHCSLNNEDEILENNDQESEIRYSRNFGSLKSIFIYPIKSCGEFSISNNWLIDKTGLKFDREWMIITAACIPLTQKHEPKLCLIKPIVNEKEQVLELNFCGFRSISVPLYVDSDCKESEVSLCQSKVCGERVKCIDCGDGAAEWLDECLSRSGMRLVRLYSNNSRKNKAGHVSELSLVNQAPYLLVTTASIRYLADFVPNFDLNEHSLSNLIARFRANFIVETNSHHIENICESIEMGKLKFKCVGPCTRCQMICIDQQTGEKSTEPLKTLLAQTKGNTRFGVYLSKVQSAENTISLGEKVIFRVLNK